MKNKPSLFPGIEKECEFKTYQDIKCVNEKNKNFRLVNSCREEFCPRMGNGMHAVSNGSIELTSKVNITESKN